MPNEKHSKSPDLAAEALRLHARYKGKVQTMAKCPVRELRDFSYWYTPGVAAACLAIHAEPERVYDYTNKGNSIAIISDGTRVLGLGNIGPEAGVIQADWIRQMNPDPILFACANPTPEIWPDDAKYAGATIIATGRGDFPKSPFFKGGGEYIRSKVYGTL